jgi:hypothetical protein
MEIAAAVYGGWKLYKCVSSAYSAYKTGMFVYNVGATAVGAVSTATNYIVGTPRPWSQAHFQEQDRVQKKIEFVEREIGEWTFIDLVL